MTTLISQFESYTALSTNKNVHMSGSWAKTLRSYLIRYIDWYELHSTLNHYQGLMQWVGELTCAESTKAVIAAGLGRFLNWYEYIDDSQFKKIRLSYKLPLQNWSNKHLTQEQVVKIITQMKQCYDSSKKFDSTKYTFLTYLLSAIGLRITQATLLNLNDILVSSDSCTFTIKKLKKNNLKSECSIQKISIPLDHSIGNHKFKDIFNSYILLRNKYSGDALFIDKTSGNRMGVRWYQHKIHTISEELGIKNLTPHSFRHYVGNKAAQEKGVLYACNLLGHSMFQTTQRYISENKEVVI